MSDQAIPARRQPDAVPEQPLLGPPSLWLYGALLLFAAVLIAVAFRRVTDWPALLVNLATEIIGAVIVLVLVERRLRESEIHTLRRFPRRAGAMLFLAASPTHRQLYRYARAFLARLEQVLSLAIERRSLGDLRAKVERGFILFGKPGTGKTTWLQMIAAQLAREYLASPRTSKVPVLFPLRRWMPSHTLEEAIYEHVNSYAPVSLRAFRAALRDGAIVGFLDGADELCGRSPQEFQSQLDALRKKYPVAWTLTSRASVPSPARDLEGVSLTQPTEDELREIRRRSEA